ncbi:hypothetical protein [Legionella brunensis]|uniref:Inclusion membrane protein A n=1 Tax=Legionella brunensis TaxID=29422 RepID=A0A0W0SP98_9GAMM|nr:hypothetical protein [Legionella brunensis]KTC85206.1 hypothetical protein Lbru_1002 [Legionella brunensis]
MKENEKQEAESLVIETVKKSAFDSIQHLKKQQERIALFKSDLDLLLKRYNSKKSLFGTLADWYSDQSLWRQITIVISALIATTLIGLLVSMLVTYSLLLIGGGMIYLFQDFHNVEQERAELFCKDILKMQEDMTQSVKSLNEIETKLFDLFQILAKKNEEYAAIITDLKDKIKYLQEQIEFFEEALKKLKEVNESIIADTKEIHDLSNTFKQQISELQQKFTNLDVEKDVLSKMQRIQLLLQESENSLAQHIQDLKKEKLAAKTGESTFEQTLTDGKVRVAQSKETLAKVSSILEKFKMEDEAILSKEHEEGGHHMRFFEKSAKRPEGLRTETIYAPQ